MIKNSTVKKLLVKYKEISLLGKVSGLVHWDTNVNLPSKGSNTRSEVSSFLTKIYVEKWHEKEFKSLLTKANTIKDKLTPEEVAILRNLNHAGKSIYKIPKNFL